MLILMRKFLLFILFVALGSIAFAQTEQENYYVAEDFLEDEDWNQAIDVYKELLYQDPENVDLNFRLGFCYLNTPFDKAKAVYYLKKAADHYTRRKRAKNKPPIETFFYLGKAYEMTYQFEKAIEEFNFLNTRVKGVDKNFRKLIEQEILHSTNGLGFYLNPIEYKIIDSLPCVNSAYSDYSPVVSANDSVFFFTSKRLENYGEDTYASGQKMEDIYIVQHRQGMCDTAYNAGPEFNSASNDAVVGISPDGLTLFIYKDEDLGSIYQSRFLAGKWTIPEKLPEPINSPLSRETSASLSADGKQLFFTSDRKKGYGGLDIYMSKKLPNGNWSEPENLGPSINTDLDEESPYLFPDGVTLFFASKGHTSMGGFDLFYINLDRTGKWPGAINLGYPINTTDDDLFIVPMVDGKTFYISSRTLGGRNHWSNIYKIEVPFVETDPVTMYNGQLSICTGNLPRAQIDVFNSLTKEHYITTYSDIVTGNFSFYYPSEKPMTMRILIDGAVIYADTIHRSNEYRALSKHIKLRTNEPCDTINSTANVKLGSGVLYQGVYYNQVIELDPIYFESGRSNLKSINGLDTLIAFLKRNLDTIIEISAFADSKGPATYNLKLTELRANAVKKYFTDQGVEEKQIVAKGYGENVPIAYEFEKPGIINNVAANYNRRVEVKVIKQGKNRLYIHQNFAVPEDIRI
jgi:outer membrane protein OmpA-like peptidoglycan-associated protein/Tol biopolymer transport system component